MTVGTFRSSIAFAWRPPSLRSLKSTAQQDNRLSSEQMSTRWKANSNHLGFSTSNYVTFCVLNYCIIFTYSVTSGGKCSKILSIIITEQLTTESFFKTIVIFKSDWHCTCDWSPLPNPSYCRDDRIFFLLSRLLVSHMQKFLFHRLQEIPFLCIQICLLYLVHIK